MTLSVFDQGVSMVANAGSNITRLVTVRGILNAIKAGKWKRQIDGIRAECAVAVASGMDPKDAVAESKKRLPAVIWSGDFKTRKKAVPLAEKLRRHSGILCADLDNVAKDRIDEARRKLAESRFVFAVLVSPTGTGLKVLYRVRPDADQHGQSFEAVRQDVSKLIGWEIDPQCKDVQRLCYVSFDPDPWLRNGEPDEIEPVSPPHLGGDVTQSTHSANGVLRMSCF